MVKKGFNPAPFHLAWRLVFRRERRITSHLKGTVLGISLSLIPLVLVMVVSSGLIRGITARFLEIGTYHLQARSYSADVNWQEAAEKIAAVPGVSGTFPVIRGLGMLYSSSGRAGITLKGLPSDVWETDTGFRSYMILEEGSFDLSDEKGIVISRGIADELSVGIGDSIKLLSSRTSSSGALFLRPSFFTVTGICSSGYYELDAMTAYVSYSRAESILRDQGIRYIGIKVDEPFENMDNLRREIGLALNGEWYLMSWQELQRPMYASFETSRNLILLIMALIVLVATLNISATLGMLVLENREQIAILKATGTGRSQIALVFLAAGLLTGIAGVVPGIAAGALIAVNINSIISFMENLINGIITLFTSGVGNVDLFNSSFYLDTIPVKLDGSAVLGIVGFTLGVAVLSALIPALRAAVLRPLHILQKR